MGAIIFQVDQVLPQPAQRVFWMRHSLKKRSWVIRPVTSQSDFGGLIIIPRGYQIDLMDCRGKDYKIYKKGDVQVR